MLRLSCVGRSGAQFSFAGSQARDVRLSMGFLIVTQGNLELWKLARALLKDASLFLPCASLGATRGQLRKLHGCLTDQTFACIAGRHDFALEKLRLELEIGRRPISSISLSFAC